MTRPQLIRLSPLLSLMAWLPGCTTTSVQEFQSGVDLGANQGGLVLPVEVDSKSKMGVSCNATFKRSDGAKFALNISRNSKTYKLRLPPGYYGIDRVRCTMGQHFQFKSTPDIQVRANQVTLGPAVLLKIVHGRELIWQWQSPSPEQIHATLSSLASQDVTYFVSEKAQPALMRSLEQRTGKLRITARGPEQSLESLEFLDVMPCLVQTYLSAPKDKLPIDLKVQYVERKFSNITIKKPAKPSSGFADCLRDLASNHDPNAAGTVVISIRSGKMRKR